MRALADGDYDAFVLDAEVLDDDVVRLELTITAGEHKGDVIAVRASRSRLDVAATIGLPAVLRVVDGVPRVEFDD